MKVSDYGIDHPVPVTIVCAILVLFGVIAVASLTQSLFPDFTKPTVYVTVEYPGVAPEEMESQVTSLIESELAKVSDIISFSSRSLPSFSAVMLEFDWSVNVDDKLVEIRERLNAIQDDLPEGVQGIPRIRKMNPSEMPILTVGLEGGGALIDGASYLEKQAVPLVSAIPGVSAVDLLGAPEQELAVRLDLERLSGLGISPLEVVQALSVSGVVVPAGEVGEGAEMLKVTTSSTFSALDQVGRVVVANRGGALVRVEDLADLEVAESPPERYSLINGERALILDITAQRGVDTVKIIEAAKKAFSSLEQASGGNISFIYYRDQSTSIRAAVRSVRNSAILGGTLAVVILFLFLGEVRATVIIALSIPFSVLFTFISLYLGGHSLNTMTLGGLTMAVGMIVDASIVMLENIWRHARGGENPAAAAKKGAGEMGGAIIASTLTSIVVFVPLVFVPGIAGIVLRDIALTIIYALSGSVIVAVILVPFLSARLFRTSGRPGRKGTPASPPPLAKGGRVSGEGRLSFFGRFSRWLDGLEAAYSRTLEKILGHAGFTIAVSSAVLILSVALLSTLGFEFIPAADSREIILELDLPQGHSLDKSYAAAREADRRIQAEIPEAARRIFYVGQAGAFSASATVPTHVYGIILLGPGGRSSFDLIPILRESLLASIPDVRVNVRNGGNSEKTATALGGAGFRVSLSGPDAQQAARAAEHVVDVLARDPEVAGAAASVTLDVRSLTSDIDLAAAGALGVTPQDAAQISRIVFAGVEAGEYEGVGDGIPIRVYAGLETGLTETVFDSIPVRSRSGKVLSLGAVSSLSERRGLSEIPKESRLPSVQVVAQLRGSSFRGVQERLEEHLARNPLPEGISWKVAGAAEETADSFRSLGAALLLAVILVYAVMAIQFERYRQPFIVLLAVPFVLIGVVTALLAFGSTLSIIALLGIIALAGVAINNSIIMIDYTNLLRGRDGLPLREAVIRGASSRIRPILMTTLTTLLAVLPLAFAQGESRTVGVLGQAFLGGLTTSTLVSFFLTPSLYWLTESRALRRAEARRSPGALPGRMTEESAE